MTDQPTHYRRRPAEIQAVQWTDTNAEALTAFAGHRFMTVDPEDRIDDPDATASLCESAHECWSLLRPGDWVVKRGDDFAVLTSEEFVDLYEPAAVLPPADRAALRDRIAAAIVESDGVPSYEFAAKLHRAAALREADAVLAVLPAPVDRVAVLLWAADQISAHEWDEGCDGVGCCADTPEAAAKLLRRLAAEATPEPATDAKVDEATATLRRVRSSLRTLKDQGATGRMYYQTITEALAGPRPDTAVVEPQPDDTQTPVHAVPLPGSNGISSCCGRPPCEFVGERVTRDAAEVTCKGVDRG